MPNEDKEKADKSCVMGSEFYDFEYNYDKKSKSVEVKYQWKVTCDFFRVINRKYKSYYDLSTKMFRI